MRNPLKHLAQPDRPRKPLRERLAEAGGKLAAAKEKAGRLVAVNRILLGPPPQPEPSVDRVALVNYATFLAHERERVCAELYPHLGRKASAFVLTRNAADRFFYSQDGRSRRIDPSASTRALAVLDTVGIDWREDTDENSRRFFDEGERADTGERPAMPHGWPALDAVLLEALDDLSRLDAAIGAMLDGNPSRDPNDVPGFADLEKARDGALARLARNRAETLTGLQVKAKALLTSILPVLQGDDFGAIAASLSRDLLRARPTWLDGKPDPILAAIAECERLEAEADAVEAARPPGQHVDPAAASAVTDHLNDVVLKTVPTSAEGCKALARFLPAFLGRWGANMEKGAPTALALIARSPLL